MEQSKIKAVEMVRATRDEQYEQTKNMNDDEKIEFYRRRAVLFLAKLDKEVEAKNRLKKISPGQTNLLQA